MVTFTPHIVDGRLISYGVSSKGSYPHPARALSPRQSGKTITEMRVLRHIGLCNILNDKRVDLSYYAANARCPISTRLEARNTRALKGKSVVYPSTVYTVEGMLALMGKPKFTK